MTTTEERPTPMLDPGESWEALRARLDREIEELDHARSVHAAKVEMVEDAERLMRLAADRQAAARASVRTHELRVTSLIEKLLSNYGDPDAAVYHGGAF